ncbi:hypothetical protein mRhiFer1_010241 [Rhinolophus ferrumequinum]|uniref:Uncharacterized protein n=1 Tax=Rhinolophus ferrumequinum TaxID=59479 RepID=A0A7J7X5A6_RHIFE|nr:hypothetical protein mRhiFer1_010241 [Rhinolophus ferrumequinum]
MRGNGTTGRSPTSSLKTSKTLQSITTATSNLRPPAALPGGSVLGSQSSVAWILLKGSREGVQERLWDHHWFRGLSSYMWDMTSRTGLGVGSSAWSTGFLPHFALRLTPPSLCLTPTYLISLDGLAASLSDATT